MDAGSIRPLAPQQEATLIRQDVRTPAVPFERVRADMPELSGPAPPAEPLAALTPDERDYFERLFPASSDEVRSYPTYSPSGLRMATVSGTMIDRKG